MNAKNKGFTLIELLVVIAIIAMLLAILIPSLNKAKMFAEEIMCKSNIHQYHIATETYAIENKEYYPNPWISLYKSCLFNDATFNAPMPAETQSGCRWHNPNMSLQAYPKFGGPYWPYLSVTKANICPTFAKLAPKFGEAHSVGVSYPFLCIGAPFVPQFSYAMNSQFNIDSNPAHQCQNALTARRTQVKSPSETFLWAEENMWVLTNPVTHATLTGSVLNDTSLRVPNPNPDPVTPARDAGSDGFGSFHKISTAQLTTQQSTKIYNAGMADVLFTDGHADFTPPMDLKTGENIAARYKGVIR
jgi:prepilin-type N-terminal cleavage/methylation domain-containing protein